MTLVSVLPWIAGALLAGVMFWIAQHDGAPRANAWIFPAGLSVLFFSFSAAVAFREGPLGFWTEHTRNLWGNQIWFDLLLAAGVAWTFIVPRARRVNMLLLPWLVLILGTGSIGLLAMASRVLYLEARAG